MLSNNLDNSMQKAMKYENLTKASKFGNVKNLNSKEKSLEKEILMLQKISKYVKDDYTKNIAAQSEDIKEEKPICEQEKTNTTGLPFFKSISYKLSEEFCV